MTAGQRLLLFNLRTDTDDHILGFTTQWINALAPHFDHIDVLTMHRGRLEVAENVTVYSSGREAGYGNLRRVFEFYRILIGLCLRHRYVGAFAHMAPLSAVMSAPILWPLRIPITTWYTHRQKSLHLRGAVWVSRQIVTAVPSSFPIPSPKVFAIGHGIDTDFFAPDEREHTDEEAIQSKRRLVYVARLTDIKHQHILLEATRDLDVEIVLVGDVPDGYSADYKAKLKTLAQDFNMTERVIFAGAQTREQVRDWYRTATCAVNLSPVGLFDKSALEAMACAVPTIVSNKAFRTLTAPFDQQLEIDHPNDVTTLRASIIHLLEMPLTQRQEIGYHLRTNVINQHSLSRLVHQLVMFFDKTSILISK